MRIGSLFTGYGGLDLAVGGDLAWYSEIEPAACKVLAHHYPGVPNLGDITEVDWADVEPVDIITGGYPCQPFSHAGRREGTNDERHLWPFVAEALRTLRPMVGIFENVDGHRSLGLDVVLGDLAQMGRDARWGVVRASDAGAPHHRARVFIVTTDPDRAQREDVLLRPTGSVARLPLRPSGLPRSSTSWGAYGPSIERWEHILGRPAPAPTVPGRAGRHRLNAEFSEWMMGLPQGHVTGHGLGIGNELKMLGNGVCPQQARLALEQLLKVEVSC